MNSSRPTNKEQKQQFKEDWGSLSLEELHEKYKAPIATIRDWANQWGFYRGKARQVSKPEVYRAVSRQDIDMVEEAFKEMLSHKIQALPEIKISQPKVVPDEETETQVCLFSDAQCGVKTSSYNKDIFVQRLRELRDKLVLISAIQRKAHPIDELDIFALGDNVHGERVGRQVNLDELECTAHVQICDVFVPAFCEFLVNLLQNYNKINVYSVEGNHGWPGGRESAYGSNWDTFAIELVKAKLSNYKRIKIEHERGSFFKLVEVKNHYFLLAHGDQIPMHMTVPYYGVTTKGMRWKGSISPDLDFTKVVLEAFKSGSLTVEQATRRMSSQPFEYLCLGHFHTSNFLQWNDITVFMNGTLLTDDPFPLKKMGLGSKACQWTFGVHPVKGLSFMYPLYLK